GPDRAWWANDDKADRISTSSYSGVRRTARYVMLRDNVRLAIDVYLPDELKAGARLPSILEQTRYRRSFEFKPEVREAMDRPPQKVTEFVTRGYAYVIVDVRGSGASFGSRRGELLPLEVRDGKDVVDWIVSQPWSNGRVGATGVSYVGTTAELLLVNQHPAVRAIVPQFSLFDAYQDIVFPGGVQHTWFLKVWAQVVSAMDRNVTPEQQSQQILGVRPVEEDSDKALLAQALREHAMNIDVHAELAPLVYRDDRARGDWTLEEISPKSYVRELVASRSAIYSYSGWYDGGYPRSAINRFLTVRTPGSRLVLGPWNHGGRFYFSPANGRLNSSFPHTLELLRFFDYHLKGIETSIVDEPRVHYYTMGEERWHSATTWPLPQARKQTWFFADDNSLSRARPAAGKVFDTYRVDYTAGTGSLSRWNTLVGGGPVDYADRSAEDRKLLTYTSAQLEHDMEITGHPVVTLFVSSTADDAQFFVYLEDVDEAGRVRYVTEGQLRALHRKLSTSRPPYKTAVPYRTFLRRDARPFVPGQITQLTFDLLPTSYLFRKGRRVRIAIAGADRDHFDPLPGPPPTVQFYRGGAYRSRIDLPLIPRRQSR
ncbi:MAG TPA: CocE/NonD family hydrolase, partial [Gemmatimonadaceae bacterium]|nr:CocE/NonD family hydrolase [Gemmatimonadaceae bacterium]